MLPFCVGWDELLEDEKETNVWPQEMIEDPGRQEDDPTTIADRRLATIERRLLEIKQELQADRVLMERQHQTNSLMDTLLAAGLLVIGISIALIWLTSAAN